MSQKCHRTGCVEPPLKLFCKEHLKNPPTDKINLTNEHFAMPMHCNVKFNPKSECSLNNSMASALQMMSPLCLREGLIDWSERIASIIVKAKRQMLCL